MKANSYFRFVNAVTLCTYFLTVLSLTPRTGFAIPNGALLDATSKNNTYARAEEYFSEIYQGEILVPVNLLGAVGKPGVYHIPKQTDLIRLLSLAGGTRGDLLPEEISIKRRVGESEKLMNVNMKDLVQQKGTGKPLNLEANDIVLVIPKEPAISNNTLAIVGFATSLLSLVVTSLLIANQIKN